MFGYDTFFFFNYQFPVNSHKIPIWNIFKIPQINFTWTVSNKFTGKFHPICKPIAEYNILHNIDSS